MAEGLRHHYHQYYEDYVKKYRDSEGMIIKKIFYRCMICGQAHVENTHAMNHRQKENTRRQDWKKHTGSMEYATTTRKVVFILSKTCL
jgi:hypothetical protein